MVALLVVGGIGGLKYLDYLITSEAYPDIWNKPEVLKNYRLHEGHVTFVFPKSIQILEALGICNGEKIQNAVIQTNEVDFYEIDYGNNEFEITLLDGSSTNRIDCFHYHGPNWSRERFEIQSLSPLEYKTYSNGELVDNEDGWTTITNRTNAFTLSRTPFAQSDAKR